MTRLGDILDTLMQATAHLAALREQGEGARPWAADDLLTAPEALKRLRAGRDNREARALLDRTERRHAPGDARWRWGDILEATARRVEDPKAPTAIPMADLRARKSRGKAAP